MITMENKLHPLVTQPTVYVDVGGKTVDVQLSCLAREVVEQLCDQYKADMLKMYDSSVQKSKLVWGRTSVLLPTEGEHR